MFFLMDIIFLLLIFFMLIFFFVVFNVLNLKLLSSFWSSIFSSSQVEDVCISCLGNYFLDNWCWLLGDMEKEICCIFRSSKFSIIIFLEEGILIEYVVVIMDLVMCYKVNGVLVMEKDQMLSLCEFWLLEEDLC